MSISSMVEATMNTIVRPGNVSMVANEGFMALVRMSERLIEF
jgi:hypothetical protein